MRCGVLWPPRDSLRCSRLLGGIQSKTPPETEIGWKLVRWGAVAALPALAGIVYCFYRIATVGKRRHHRIGKSLNT